MCSKIAEIKTSNVCLLIYEVLNCIVVCYTMTLRTGYCYCNSKNVLYRNWSELFKFYVKYVLSFNHVTYKKCSIAYKIVGAKYVNARNTAFEQAGNTAKSCKISLSQKVRSVYTYLTRGCQFWHPCRLRLIHLFFQLFSKFHCCIVVSLGFIDVYNVLHNMLSETVPYFKIKSVLHSLKLYT